MLFVDWWIAAFVGRSPPKRRHKRLYVFTPIHSHKQQLNWFPSLFINKTTSFFFFLQRQIKPREMKWSSLLKNGMEFARGEGWAPAITHSFINLTYLLNSSNQTNPFFGLIDEWEGRAICWRKKTSQANQPSTHSIKKSKLFFNDWVSWLGGPAAHYWLLSLIQ